MEIPKPQCIKVVYNLSNLLYILSIIILKIVLKNIHIISDSVNHSPCTVE